MTAEEMVMVARLADHYEKLSSEYDALALAEHDFKKFKRVAPELWKRLHDDSTLSARAIGDWLAEFFLRWSRSGMSVKNFAADELDALIAKKAGRSADVE